MSTSPLSWMDDISWQQKPESDRDLPTPTRRRKTSASTPSRGLNESSETAADTPPAPPPSPPPEHRMRGLEADNVRLKAERDYLQCQLDHLRKRVLLLDQVESRAEPSPTRARRQKKEEAEEAEDEDEDDDDEEGPVDDRGDYSSLSDSMEEINSRLLGVAAAIAAASAGDDDPSPASSLDLDLDPPYHEVEDNHESKYAPNVLAERLLGTASDGGGSENILLPSAIPPKVTIHRKILRRPSAIGRLSYPTSSTSNSSERTPSIHLRRQWPPPPPPTPARGAAQTSTGTQTPPLSTCEQALLATESRVIKKKRCRAPVGRFPSDSSARQRPSLISHHSVGANTAPNTPDGGRQRRGRLLLATYSTGRPPLPLPGPDASPDADFLASLAGVHEVFAFVKGRVHLVQTSRASGVGETADEGERDSADSCDDCCSCLTARTATRADDSELSHNGAVVSANPASPQHQQPTANVPTGIMSESVTSMGYYSPPDDVSMCSALTRSLDGPSLAANVAPPERRVLRAGLLAKLSGRFKLWHRHWCILTNKGLFFYSARPRPNERPSQCVSLDEVVRAARPPSVSGPAPEATIELRTPGRCYTLCAESSRDADLWLRKLKRALRRQRAMDVIRRHGPKLLHQGWLKRIKCATARRMWCVLMGAFLVYFRSPQDLCPTGYRDLNNTCVQVVAGQGVGLPPDSDSSDTNENRANQHQRTLSLWYRQPVPRVCTSPSRYRDPVYLIAASEQDFERWLHYLRVVCRRNGTAPGGSTPSVDLPGPDEVLTPGLVDRFHFSVPLSTELVAASTPEEYRELALSLGSSLDRLAASTPGPGDLAKLSVNHERVRTIQEMARVCFDHPGLKDELFLLLLKQTKEPPPTPKKTRRPWRQHPLKASPTRSSASSSSGGGASSASSGNHSRHPGGVAAPATAAGATLDVHSCAWRCLALMIPLFLPSPPTLAFIKHHLTSLRQRRPPSISQQPSASHSSEVQKYASFCLDSIARVEANGGRSRVPSFLEILSVHMHPPYGHSKPFSLPIHLPFGSYRVVGFDGSSTVLEILEFTSRLLCKRGLSDLANMAHLGLYCRTPLHQFAYLDERWKLGDVISKCEDQAGPDSAEDAGGAVGGSESSADPSPQLFMLVRSYSRRLFLHSPENGSPSADEGLLPLLKASVWQIHNDIKAGRYNIGGKDLLRLTAHLCQCEYGNYRDLKNKDSTLSKIVTRHFPDPLTDDEDRVMHLKLLLLEEWSLLTRKSPVDACRAYLALVEGVCRDAVAVRLSNCQCQRSQEQVYMLVTHTQLNVINASTHALSKTIHLKDFVSFGAHGSRSLFVVYHDARDNNLVKLYYRFATLSTVLELIKTLTDVLSNMEHTGRNQAQ